MDLPQFFRLRQTFKRPVVRDIPATVEAELRKLNLAAKISPGQTVAITAGSRGIANIPVILKAIVNHVKSLDGVPFIVPAMGSHGGATAEGQVGVLASLGITPHSCGCEIRASMETVVVCQAQEGFPVYFDRHAFQADHVIVCGRIKKHTDFTGEIQSGLMKMMLIGLGKHHGAKIYHRAIHVYSFPQIMQSVASEVLAKCPILCGVGIIENGYDETAHIEALAASDIEAGERKLLAKANALFPQLPFDEADLLIIDEIGKNISGAGMDTNIVGRKYNDHAATGDETPRILRIFVRGLTEATHGNATGIGMAEFCLTRVIEQMDRQITNINCVTSGHVTAGMLPLYYDTDCEAIEAALQTIGLTEPAQAKVMWIPHTLKIDEVLCSEAYLNEARDKPHCEVVGTVASLPFDSTGMLPAFPAS